MGNKMKLIAVLFAVILVAASCAARQTPIPNAESEGAKLFASRCSRCHSLPHPKRHSFAEWEWIVARMEGRIANGLKTAMAEDKKAEILKYLKENSR
jgi:cytochrome c5